MELASPVELDENMRGNPKLPLPLEPTLPKEARVSWVLRDSLAIANALSPRLVQQMRTALQAYDTDRVMVTPNGEVASGLRVELAALKPTNPEYRARGPRAEAVCGCSCTAAGVRIPVAPKGASQCRWAVGPHVLKARCIASSTFFNGMAWAHPMGSHNRSPLER